MGTVKWHMLNHVAEDIVRNGGLYLCDPGLYDYTHTTFNQPYAKTSKKRMYAMGEFISIVRRRISENTADSPLKRPKPIEIDEEFQELFSSPENKSVPKR